MIHQQLTPKVFTGERPSKEGFVALQKLGVTLVINLQSGAHEFFKDDKYEFQRAENFGIKEVNVKCGDIFAPSAAEVAEVLRLIAEHDGKVYIHCLHGKDRTGFMRAVYRMKHCGWDYDRAVREMFRLGFHKAPYYFWLIELKKYSK